MSFLGIGPLEFLLILLVAIILIGPRDLSQTARAVGRALRRVYQSEAWRALTQVSHSLRELPETLVREAELDELAELRRTAAGVKEDLEQGLKSFQQDMHELDESMARAQSASKLDVHPDNAPESPDHSP